MVSSNRNGEVVKTLGRKGRSLSVRLLKEDTRRRGNFPYGVGLAPESGEYGFHAFGLFPRNGKEEGKVLSAREGVPKGVAGERGLKDLRRHGNLFFPILYTKTKRNGRLRWMAWPM